MPSTSLTLQERVRIFNRGTPTPMHVGTHELVNDLWRELEKRSENHVALAAEQKREGCSSTAAHTPGPWTVTYFKGEADQIVGPDGVNIASMYATDGLDEPTLYPVNANARLIAAAPDMLAALLRADKLLEHTDTWARGETHEIVRAAIARATGAA